MPSYKLSASSSNSSEHLLPQAERSAIIGLGTRRIAGAGLETRSKVTTNVLTMAAAMGNGRGHRRTAPHAMRIVKPRPGTTSRREIAAAPGLFSLHPGACEESNLEKHASCAKLSSKDARSHRNAWPCKHPSNARTRSCSGISSSKRSHSSSSTCHHLPPKFDSVGMLHETCACNIACHDRMSMYARVMRSLSGTAS